ncbi:hypothetical protein CZ814_01263 [Photobacterium toruni]|uniref:Lysozyme inhibitor LprI N-terminal domain-containing protein n=1 Tax=Photobacterium toruni TaxID=1935446 RepID=A0A1T4RBZ6_9GAMM|nr:hypothetical protein CZ814_01263 [Photobacterium toruni]
MLIFIRTLLLLLLITFHTSSYALTINQYTQKHALLPCTGLETKINSFEKRITMMLSNASKKEKSNLKNEYKALHNLYKQKKCHKRKFR